MKYLLLLLTLLPISAQSQTLEHKATSFTEIGLNLGYAPDNASNQQPNLEHWRGGYVRSSLSVLKNVGNIQYGATIEGGTNSNDYWYLSPAVLLNRKFYIHKAYFYAGAMTGYVCSDDMLGSPRQKIAQGYIFGFQGGIVQPIDNRIAFSSELAVRSTQLWARSTVEQIKTQSSIVLYFPITIGIRYRF